MNYSEFVKKAVLQDKRNVFSEYSGSLDFIPQELRGFYSLYNPDDVEVYINGAVVKFAAADDLEEWNREYGMDEGFVFAESNGDPIFIYRGEVCTCSHGVKTSSIEFLADSFDDFLNQI